MPAHSSLPVATAAGTEQPNQSALALVTSLFFMWGFLTVLNDILVPHFKAIFDLNYTRVMLIQFTFFMAYFLLSVPVGKIVGWIGYQRSMVLGLGIAGLGALLFLPAAEAPSYTLFLAALFVLAAGMTVLQVSCNPYVAVLGPPHTASSRLNLAQAFNSLGTAIAPWLGGVLILSNSARTAAEVRTLSPEALAAYRMAEASSVKLPYLIFAGVLFAMGVVMWRVKLPVLSTIESGGAELVQNGQVVKSAWRVRHLVLGAAGIFLYCGAEVSIGSFLVNFFSQPEIGGLSEKAAAGYVSYYWSGAMIGRFAGVGLTRWISPGRLLGLFALVASALVWVCIVSTGAVALWAIILVGLFNSIMFPNIFALAIEGLGRLTSQGSGILFMAVLGPAVIPLAQGALADRIGIQHAFVIPALCYLYVVYYGLRGCRH
jgi:FHS family L-fucose permease-like MFS transporter